MGLLFVNKIAKNEIQESHLERNIRQNNVTIVLLILFIL